MTYLARLEEVARAATPGEWLFEPEPNEAGYAAVLGGGGCIAEDVSHADAAHIAAFDPPTALAMLAVCKAAVKWWEMGRPVVYSEAEHIAHPTVNRDSLSGGHALARAVAALKALEELP